MDRAMAGAIVNLDLLILRARQAESGLRAIGQQWRLA